MTSLRRGVKLGLMKKLFLYVFLGLLWCNVGFAECIEGDCINGHGTFTYVSGDKYIGGWKENKEHGQGTYTWASGHKYVGEYKDGKRHGQGTFTATDGRVTRGIWENGELVEPN